MDIVHNKNQERARLMRFFFLAAAAALAVNAVAVDFFRPGFDDGKALPADRIYPAGRIFPFTGFSPLNAALVESYKVSYLCKYLLIKES